MSISRVPMNVSMHDRCTVYSYCLWIMFKTELLDLSYDWKEIVIVYSAASRADGVLVC